MLVAANKQLYITLPKRQKMLLSRSIVNAVRSQKPPGRFLQRDSKTSLWYDVGDQRAQEKTSQALREGAPDIRKKVAAQQQQQQEAGSASADQGALERLGDSGSTDLASNETVDAGTVSKKSVDAGPEPQRAESGGSSDTPTGSNRKKMPPPPPKTPPQAQSQNMGQNPPMMFYNNTGQMPMGNHNFPQEMAAAPNLNGSQLTPQQQQQQMIFYQNNGNQVQLYPTMVLNDQGVMVPAMGVMPYGMVPPAGGMSPQSSGSIPQTNPSSRTPSSDSYRQEASDQLEPLPGDTRQVYQNQQYSQNGQLPTFEDAQILPPGGLEPGTYSFGSITMSDADQLKLESTGISFGSAMSTNTTKTNLTSVTARNNAMVPPQADLDTGGVSFGGMSISSMPQSKLENVGTSFGSAMSVSTDAVKAAMVDGGLEGIGTSFGSLSLDTTNRETLFQSLEAAAAGPEIPPMLQGERTSANLLDCSSDEEEQPELQSQESSKWQKMQQTLARQGGTTRSTTDSQGEVTPPSQNKASVPPIASIPVTNMERDFSALSAIETDRDEH